MGHTACTEPQCLYKGALYLFLLRVRERENKSRWGEMDFLTGIKELRKA
jgi:hypothetical protein